MINKNDKLICPICKIQIKPIYYAYGLDKNNKKFILEYYCEKHIKDLKIWLNNNLGNNSLLYF